MKIKIVSLLVFAFLILCVFADAQNIDTISYVPVKTGYYDKITTKSVTALAQEVGDVTATNLKANSSKFILDTRKLTFGKSINVKDSVYTQGPAIIAVKNKIVIQGNAQVAGKVSANLAQGASAVQATDIDMRSRKLDVGAAPVYVDGIPIESPSGCSGLEWKSVNAKDQFGSSGTYRLLGCTGGGGPSCTCSSGYYPGQSAYCGGSQYCTKTCQSDCQWSTCVGNSGYTWNGSACVSPSACTDTYGPSVSVGYVTLAFVQQNDTCNGETTSYTCPGTARTCVDYFQNSGCTGQNWGTYTQAGTWTLVSDNYSTYSKISSTCQPSATSMISPSSYGLGDFTNALAKEVCVKQCYGLTGSPIPCDSECRIVGNCWPNSNNVGYYCQVRDLKCTKTETTCSVAKRDVKCCNK